MLLQSHTHWLYHSWPSVMARSKSMPQSTGRLDDLDPLIALTAERKRASEMQHVIRYMICEKGICFLSEKVLAIVLRKMVHSLAIPPVEAKTNGVKTPCSTSLTLSAYCLFFSCSCMWYTPVSYNWGTIQALLFPGLDDFVIIPCWVLVCIRR